MDIKSNPLVCCVMCTYGRFETVRQSLTMFLAQDYVNKKLVIFNTSDVPLTLDQDLLDEGSIRVINQTAQSDGKPFSCLGDVRNAALEHAEGDLYACWDDDDLFLPWHLSQAVSRYLQADKVAWKPNVSYWSPDGGHSFQGLMGNSMEASFVVSMNHMKKYAFSTNQSGAEHVQGGWLDHADYAAESVSPFESYGYIWGDERSPHKTSGNINAEDNFETHKSASVDFGQGKDLSRAPWGMYDRFFQSMLSFWKTSLDTREQRGVTESDVMSLETAVRDFYGRVEVELPAFLKALDDDRNPYKRDAEWVAPPGSVESFVIEHSKCKPGGFFVEFGAVDGLSQSNSYVLENTFQWRGILVEGHEESFRYLESNRPKAKVLHQVITAEDGQEVSWLQFDKFVSPQGNFDHSRVYDERIDEPPSGPGVTVIRRTGMSLSRILDEQGAPPVIDMLVIDIETSDLLNVVKSIPFDRYTFNYIGIEIPEKILSSEFFSFLTEKGFILTRVNTAGPDYIFINKNL